MNLFEKTPIRSARIRGTDDYLYSAVDVCSAILGCEYQKGRNYWKWLKHKLDLNDSRAMQGRSPHDGQAQSQTVRHTNRLKMEAADGRLRYTDVLDSSGVARLIMLFPSPKADRFKLWLADLTAEGKKVTECIKNAVNKAKDKVRRKIGAQIEFIEKMDFDIFGNEDFNKTRGGLYFFVKSKIFDKDLPVRC